MEKSNWRYWMSYQTFDCEIETVTPVHIGSGNNYSRAEYYIEGKKSKFIRVDLARFYASLKDNQQKDFNNFSKYNRFINVAKAREKNSKKEYDDAEDLGKFKNFQNDVRGKYKKYMKYQCRYNAEKDLNIIKEHIKTLVYEEDNEGKTIEKYLLYIPGSSIKGSFNTAILNAHVKNEQLRVGNEKKAFDDIIKEVYAKENVKNQAQNSVMRFLYISDTEAKIDMPHVEEVTIISCFQPRKLDRTVFSNLGIKSFYETIPSGTNFKFTISDRRHRKVLDELDINNVIDIDKIKQNLYDFSNRIIREEINYLRNSMEYIDEKNKFFISHPVENLIKFYEELENTNSPENPYFRIGSGSGMISTSFVLKGQNGIPPHSRRVICDKNNNLRPLGWSILTKCKPKENEILDKFDNLEKY